MLEVEVMNTACRGERLQIGVRAGSLIALAGLLLLTGQTGAAPFIHIDPIPDRYMGDRFTITATTSLPEGEPVLFEIHSSSSSVQKNQAVQFSGVTGTVKVVKGGGNLNLLSFDVDTATFQVDEYIVTAEAVNRNASHTIRFMLLEPDITTPAQTTTSTTTTPALQTTPATQVTTVMHARFIRIDPVPDRYVGDRFTITAATSLPEGEPVLFQVYPYSSLLQKSQTGQFSGVTGTVRVAGGDGNLNRLSFDVDTSLFTPDEYIVTAEGLNQGPSHMVRFMLREPAPATPIPPATTATPAATVQVPGSNPPDLVIPAGIVLGIIGIGAIALIRRGSLSPGGAMSGQGTGRAVEPDVSIDVRQGIEPGAPVPQNLDIRVDVESGIEGFDNETEVR